MDDHQSLSVDLDGATLSLLFQLHKNSLIEDPLQLLERPSDGDFPTKGILLRSGLAIVQIEMVGLSQLDGKMQFFLKEDICQVE